MKYQFVIFWANMTILIIVYLFMREQTQKLKLLCATTLFAYLLAALLPYMLLSIPFKWVVFLYGIAIILALIILDKMLYKHQLAIEEESANNRLGVITATEPTKNPETNAAINMATPLDTAIDMGAKSANSQQINFPGAGSVIAAIKQQENTADPEVLPSLEQTSLPADELPTTGDYRAASIDIINTSADNPALTTAEAVEPQESAANIAAPGVEQTAVTADEVQTAAVVTDAMIDTDDDEASAEMELPGEYLADEDDDSVDKEENAVNYYAGSEVLDSKPDIDETDIELLIIAAFDAKGQDDLNRALDIFEQILNLNPSEEIAQLINADIEIMLAKLQTSGN